MKLVRSAIAAILVAASCTVALAPLADAAPRKRMTLKMRKPATCVAKTFHPEVRVGNKCCFSDGHLHSGNSSSQRSKQAAMAAAVKSWADFVVWEYGASYGSFNAAVSKSMNCSGGGSDWYCSLTATPCH